MNFSFQTDRTDWKSVLYYRASKNPFVLLAVVVTTPYGSGGTYGEVFKHRRGRARTSDCCSVGPIDTEHVRLNCDFIIPALPDNPFPGQGPRSMSELQILPAPAQSQIGSEIYNIQDNSAK